MSQLLLKYSATQAYSTKIREYLNVFVISGYGILLVSLLINIYAMHKGIMAKEVSIIETLNYLFVPLFSYIIFGERLSLRKCMSIVLIVFGVVVFFQ